MVDQTAAQGEQHDKVIFRGREVPGGKIYFVHEMTITERYPLAGFTPDSFVVRNSAGQLRDLVTGKWSPALQCPMNLVPRTSHVVYSPDGFLALGPLVPPVSKGPGFVGLWERATGRLVRTWAPLQWPYYSAVIAADGKTVGLSMANNVQLRDLTTDAILGRLDTGFIWLLSLSPDGRWAATTNGDCTITLWDLSAFKKKQPPPAVLAEEEMERLWKDLVDPEANKGVPAVWRLIDAGELAIPMLAKRLKAVPRLPKDELPALLRDLDNDSFKIRDAASKRLRDLGEMAEPALLAMLQTKPTLEMSKRIEILLQPLTTGEPAKGEALRAIRAVEIVERIGSAAAIRLLEEWASGADGAPLTRAAREALARWKYANQSS
jgi:hypothetical protein